MANTYLLSDESKHYLNCYYQILDEMIQAITTARLTQSISHNFIVQVIPHHRAGERMCRNILEVSNDRSVRRLAQQIAAQRSQDIQRMEEQLPVCAQLLNPHPDLRLYQRRAELISRQMFLRMGASPENNCLNAVFLRQMVPPHLGAVRLTQNALRHEVATPLPPLLRAIADTQRRELRQIQALLQRRGCQAG